MTRKYMDLESLETLWTDILLAIAGDDASEAISDEEIDEVTGADAYPNGDEEDY